MAEWMPTRLDELVDIKHGYAFKGEFFSDEPTSDFVLTPGNFAIGGGFQWGKGKFYRGPVPEEFVLSPGDLLVTMTDLSKQADTLGYAALMPQSDYRLLHNQRLGKVALKSKRTTLSFIHWRLRAPDYRNEVLASCTGSTVKHTSPKKILAFDFLLPPIDEQKGIAELLSVLDDKIDLNRQTNETLEALARAIFKDWFVDFGPTRAKAEGRSPYLTPGIWNLFPDTLNDEDKPEGWKVGDLAGVAESPKRGIKPADVSEETPYIGLEHMPRRSIALTEWEGAGKVTSNKSIFEKGDLLFGKLRPYFHKVGIAPLNGICSTDIVVLKPRSNDWSSFVLACISSNEFVAYTDQTSTGTKMPRTSWKIMGQYEVCLPPGPIVSNFQDKAQPMIDCIDANIHENHTLTQTRDLLLPKLMSGEICLREAEKAVETVA